MIRTNHNRGFTLVELMIVLVIIGVIAAFAIPSLLEAQKAGNETAAEKALRTIVDAEANFLKSDPDRNGKDFAYNLNNLNATTDKAGNKIAYIDGVLASGTKEGYKFGTIPTYNAAGGTNRKYGFAYYAVPAAYKDTGRKTYVVNHEGVVYYKDQGASTVPATWPNPAVSVGWLKVGE